MINHAMFTTNKDATNEFTHLLRTLTEPTGKPVEVITRCKLKVKVKYVPFNEEHNIPHHFVSAATENVNMRWNADGSSTIGSYYDICFYEDYSG